MSVKEEHPLSIDDEKSLDIENCSKDISKKEDEKYSEYIINYI